MTDWYSVLSTFSLICLLVCVCFRYIAVNCLFYSNRLLMIKWDNVRFVNCKALCRFFFFFGKVFNFVRVLSSLHNFKLEWVLRESRGTFLPKVITLSYTWWALWIFITELLNVHWQWCDMIALKRKLQIWMTFPRCLFIFYMLVVWYPLLLISVQSVYISGKMFLLLMDKIIK